MQQLERLVEHRRPLARRRRVADRGEVEVVAVADAQHEPAAGEPVERAISRATFQGRRRASGITSGPNRTRVVAIAIAVSATVVSATPRPTGS